MKKSWKYGLIVLFATACGSGSDEININGGGVTSKAKVNFVNDTENVLEDESQVSIRLEFDKETTESSSIQIAVDDISAVYGQDYTTSPAPNAGIITIPVPSGSAFSDFEVRIFPDSDDVNERVEFQITAADGGLELGTTHTTIVLNIQENAGGVDPNFAACLDERSSNQLDVVTWNIEFFPMNDASTIGAVEAIVANMHADVIAVQEINSISAFNQLGSNIPGWNATVVNLSGSLDIGFLYKTSEISVINSATAVLNGQVSPRPPVSITIRHTNGLEVTMLNIHLKCCNDGVSRRETASVAMKEYLDTNFPNDNVIILGDFNDDINSGSPFSNFINDANYTFADAAIAAGSNSNWSFPSWPSHIDHILITNELTDNLVETKTIKLEGCVSNYGTVVSDHRPVMASFSN